MRGFIVMAMFLASLAGAGSAGLQEQGEDLTISRDAMSNPVGDAPASGIAEGHDSAHSATAGEELVYEENGNIIVVRLPLRGSAGPGG